MATEIVPRLNEITANVNEITANNKRSSFSKLFGSTPRELKRINCFTPVRSDRLSKRFQVSRLNRPL